MNIRLIQKQLRAKETVLLTDIARLEREARATDPTEVRDAIDDANSAESMSESLQEGTMVTETLTHVRDALQRIEEGVYGRCVLCGRPIEVNRLNAVPWAQYCLDDQKKKDKDDNVGGGSTL
jgi:DnaK suppressor protein